MTQNVKKSALTFLSVVDKRTEFSFINIGWRTRGILMPEVLCRVEEEIRLLVKDYGDALISLSPTQTPETCTLSLVVQVHNPQGLADSIQEIANSLCTEKELLLTVIWIGPEQIIGGRYPSISLRDSTVEQPPHMQVETRQGYRQTVVTGGDPAQQLGEEATFVALCLLMGGPTSVIPCFEKKNIPPVSIQLSRNLIHSVPTLIWSITGKNSEGVNIISDLVQCIEELTYCLEVDGLERAKVFARNSVQRTWLSPEELVAGVSQYELMGWGSSMIFEPERIDKVSSQDVEQALLGLVQPLKDVLGL